MGHRTGRIRCRCSDGHGPRHGALCCRQSRWNGGRGGPPHTGCQDREGRGPQRAAPHGTDFERQGVEELPRLAGREPIRAQDAARRQPHTGRRLHSGPAPSAEPVSPLRSHFLSQYGRLGQRPAAGRFARGRIFIHGLPNGMGSIGAAHTARDWTDGCIAVTNEEIEEIWSVVRDGTPIQIDP